MITCQYHRKLRAGDTLSISGFPDLSVISSNIRCLHDWWHVNLAITQNSMPGVRCDFLYLPALLARTGLLLRPMPSGCQTEKNHKAQRRCRRSEKGKKAHGLAEKRNRLYRCGAFWVPSVCPLLLLCNTGNNPALPERTLTRSLRPRGSLS